MKIRISIYATDYKIGNMFSDIYVTYTLSFSIIMISLVTSSMADCVTTAGLEHAHETIHRTTKAMADSKEALILACDTMKKTETRLLEFNFN